ncbi:MmcQ/YjbR family DNA-binding protein [soil metagenome]
MATLNDLHKLALSLPETSQAEGQIAYAVQNKGKAKGFAWGWMERIDPKKARVLNPEVIAVRVRDLHEKEAVLAIYPEKFFTEPHYNNFPAILVRLAAVEVDELQALLTTAWRCQAPPALVKRFDNETLENREDPNTLT